MCKQQPATPSEAALEIARMRKYRVTEKSREVNAETRKRLRDLDEQNMIEQMNDGMMLGTQAPRRQYYRCNQKPPKAYKVIIDRDIEKAMGKTN
jgi:hypothetical protein